MQRLLSTDQLRAFYTDTATADQVRNFLAHDCLTASPIIVDVGGGEGHFARALQVVLPHSHIRVIDNDPVAIEGCSASGVDSTFGDALNPPVRGDETVACLNLILHHLVAHTEQATAAMQARALSVWRGKAAYLFVTEYIYEPAITAALIYWVTRIRSKPVHAVANFIGRFVPSLRANTLGVGVRYRTHRDWITMFERCGFTVVAATKGRAEKVSRARRIWLLTRAISRDTFVLR